MKKNLFTFVLGAVACVLSAACTQSSTDDLSPREMTDRQLLEFLGHDTRGMIEREAYYQLKPDLIVSKARLENLRYAPETRMQKDPVYGLLNEENQTVYIQDKNAGRLKEALHAAVDEWNSIASNLRFVIDNNRYGSVEIYAGDDGYGPGTFLINIERPAKAGEYGKYARVNFNQRPQWATDYYEGRDVMMHVLGHLAGFAHAITDTSVTNPPKGHIDGTAIWDIESIMRNEQDVLKGYLWNGFSRSDREAIAKAYPVLEKASFTLDWDPAGTGTDGMTLALGTTYTFKAKYVLSSCPDPNYQVTIRKNGTPTYDYVFKDAGNGTFTIRFTKSGTYKVTVRVTNSSKSNVIERTFSVKEIAVKNITCTPEGEGAAKNQLITQTAYAFSASYSHSACPAPQYEIGIDRPSGYLLETTGNGKISVRFSEAGTYKVVARVTNAPTEERFEKTYVVTDPTQAEIRCSPAGEGADKNELINYRIYTFMADYSHPACPEPRYEIAIDRSSDYQLDYYGNGIMTVRFGKTGTYRVTVIVSNAPLPTRFEKSYTVTDPSTFTLDCTPSPSGAEKDLFERNTAYTFTAVYSHPVFTDPRYGFSVEGGTDYEMKNLENGKMSILFSKGGTYRVVARVTNAPGETTCEKICNVAATDSRVRISGPSQVDTRGDFDFHVSYENPDYPDPQFLINVRETTFDDPKYLLDRKSNRDFTLSFSEPGSYVIEATVAGAPEVRPGKFHAPAFDPVSCTLQEPVVVNTDGVLNEYATEVILMEDGGDYLQTRTAFHAQVKKDAYALLTNSTRRKIDTFHAPVEDRWIAIREDVLGVARLPLLQETKISDPFVGTIIIVPYYDKITIPDNTCREYDPALDE